MTVIQRLGWALLHFLWQGTAIVLVYAALRSLLARTLSAPARCLLACAALAAMALAPPLTFFLIPDAPAPSWTVSAVSWQWLAPAAVAVWLLGVSVFSIRLLGAWRFTARLRATSHPAPAEWQRAMARLAERMRISRSARILVSSLVDVPAVFGWLRPVILIPVEALTGMPAEQLTALLAHEMAHIARGDYLASILQSVAEALLFYHPAVWWISEQIRMERELCCDDMAVAASGDVLVYARALAALESRRTPGPRPALAASGGSLAKRIRRLIEGENTAANTVPAAGAAWAMALLWFAGIGLATVHAAPTPPPPLRMAAPEPLPLFSRTRSSLLHDLLYDPLIPGPPVQRAQAQAQQTQPRRARAVRRTVLAAPRPYSGHPRKRVQTRALPAHRLCQPAFLVGRSGMEDRPRPHLQYLRASRRDGIFKEGRAVSGRDLALPLHRRPGR
jgi:beta-lactamase regulating signal transducer with metallopeptidase domain